MNREFSSSIISKLIQWGVAEFYVCAGARNISLVETLLALNTKNKIVYNHFEERSAAFYAIGRIKSLNRPVAVVTTSGTAVAELLPAVMEAYYSGLPLVVLTADRPRSYRGTGAPQSVEQKNIFGCYSKNFDLEIGENFSLKNIYHDNPLHINLCFDVPLQKGKLSSLKVPTQKKILKNPNIKRDLTQGLAQLVAFIKRSKTLLIIVSKISEDTCKNIFSLLRLIDCPVYFESISNLREHHDLNHLKVFCLDHLWETTKKSNFNIDSILKIGGTPTHRVWRDLDEIHKNISVFSVSELKFSGLSRAIHIQTDLNIFFKRFAKKKFKKIENKNRDIFLACDKLMLNKSIEDLNLVKNNEKLFINCISKKIKNNARVYIGNSTPIRNWDSYATYKNKNLMIEASRGVNGIDGQISTFLGFASENATENWGIFGDLTALYDFAGLWMLHQRPTLIVKLVVINNFGGKIFNKVLSGKEGIFCQNNHMLNFEHYAKMWGLAYKKITTTSQLKKMEIQNTSCLIEIIPC